MDAERFTDLEIKVAYQDKTIADLEALVRSFGVRLDELSRELTQLKQAVRSPETPVGPQNEPPPHY
jgi:SlyX protein